MIALRKRTVLVVDDSETDRAIICRGLEKDSGQRYRCEHAESGAQARKALERGRADCIILDYSLPDVEGLDLLAELKQSGGAEGPPVIMLTGRGSEQIAVAALKGGADDYLAKDNSTPESIQRAVDAAIERATLQHELAQSAATVRLLEAAVQGADEMILIASATTVSCQSTIIYVNPAFTRMTGYVASEVVGQAPSFLVGPQSDRGNLALLRDNLTIGKTYHGEIVTYRKDGTPILFEWDVSPIRDVNGHMTHFVAIGRDVTERRRLEDTNRLLSEAGMVLASSLDLDTTLSSVLNLTTRSLARTALIYFSDEQGALRVAALSSVESRKEGFLREFARNDVDSGFEVLGLVRQVIREGRSIILPTVPDLWREPQDDDSVAMRALRGDLSESMICVPLSARGSVFGALILGWDEPGHYQPADVWFAEALAQRAALAIDNARLHQEAHEAIDARDSVLALVSHDLKNPLSVIRGNSQRLRRVGCRDGYLVGPDVPETSRRIEDATERMERLIDELLDVARLQSGATLALERRRTDLVVLSREVLGEFDRLVPDRAISLIAKVPALVGTWDAPRLRRVLVNLLTNAVKYSPAGREIYVSLDLEETSGGEWAVLAVVDRGIGIPASELPRIFERFHRGRNVVGRVPGTGLGLAGCRAIVEAHGGSISVVSEEGVGSTFTVRLPLDNRRT